MKIETLKTLELSPREMLECRPYLSLLYHILISSSVSSPLKIIFKVRFRNPKWFSIFYFDIYFFHENHFCSRPIYKLPSKPVLQFLVKDGNKDGDGFNGQVQFEIRQPIARWNPIRSTFLDPPPMVVLTHQGPFQVPFLYLF